MSLPPRQPRPSVAAQPRPQYSSRDDNLSFEDRALRALEYARNVDMPRIQEPGGWAYVPWVGPAWEAAYDLQEGDYAGAALNAGMLAAELSPAAPAVKIAQLVKIINKTRRAPLLARAGTQTQRIRKIQKLGPDREVHHTIAMKGADRKVEGLLRNHPANLKVMDKVTHRRLTGRWTDRDTGQTFERFGPVGRAWHGTNALQKSGVAATAAAGADAGENYIDQPHLRKR